MSSAEIATLVISLISVTASVTMSILIYFWSKKDTSTDYKLKDEVIKDLLNLEGNLNSICIKSATSHLVSKLDLDKETEFIKNFLISPTMSFILSYDDSEKDKLFYLNLFLISNNGNNIKSSAELAQKALEMLHNICKTNLIEKLRKISSIDCLQLITNNKEQVNWLLKSTNENVEKSNENKTKLIMQQLNHLKNKGVQDPYIDLFLALMSNENPNTEEMEQLVEDCAKMYGRLDVTDKEILEKYKDLLNDFVYEDSAN